MKRRSSPSWSCKAQAPAEETLAGRQWHPAGTERLVCGVSGVVKPVGGQCPPYLSRSPCQGGRPAWLCLAGTHGKADGRCPPSEQVPVPHRRSGPTWGAIPSRLARWKRAPRDKAGGRVQAVRTGERSEASGLPNQPGHISPEADQASRAHRATYGESARRCTACDRP